MLLVEVVLLRRWAIGIPVLGLVVVFKVVVGELLSCFSWGVSSEDLLRAGMSGMGWLSLEKSSRETNSKVCSCCIRLMGRISWVRRMGLPLRRNFALRKNGS